MQRERRAFVLGASVLVACRGHIEEMTAAAKPPRRILPSDAARSATLRPLFDAHPALATALPRIELGRFPSAIESVAGLLDGRLSVKRDDDFTRSPSFRDTARSEPDELARLIGGGKVRKLELLLGQARALGKRRLVTFGGVGSNQALATALLGRALGFSVRLYLAPQARSALTTKNLAAMVATGAELTLAPSVSLAEAAARRAFPRDSDAYLIPAGGTTPLGTLGFVDAGMELAAQLRASRLPAPRRIYVALGLGGTAVGLAIGTALAGLHTEIVAVRTSNPATVVTATLRAIERETLAFIRAHAPSVPGLDAVSRIRIDGRFVGAGYGVPTAAGDDAIERARNDAGWMLDPVYTGKALAALLADAVADAEGPLLFWHTQNSRPVPVGSVPGPFRRFL